MDYLLKPVDFKDLKAAINKYEKYRSQGFGISRSVYQNMYNQLMEGNTYKQRFLVKIGEQLKHIQADDIAYFISDEGLIIAVTKSNNYLPVDYSLEQLEKMLDPLKFFRLNRKVMTHISAIEKIHTYFNSRLKVILKLPSEIEVIVSRERVGGFKTWLSH